MNDEMKSVDTPRTQRPRSPRVPVDFTVEIEGRSANGEEIRVQAAVVKVSRGGATLVSEASIEAGQILRLTPPLGRTLEAEVNGVWTDAADGKQRIGVKLLEAHGWFAE
jgi:hypothetical protein